MRNNKRKPRRRGKANSTPHVAQPNTPVIYKGDGRVNAMTFGMLSLRASPQGDRSLRLETVVPFASAFSTSASVVTSKVYTFQLSDIANATSLSALFDQYRILGVQVLLSPRETTQSELLDFTTAIDFDGSASAPTANSIQQYSTALTCSTNQQQLRSFRPMWANQVYNTTTAYSAGPANQWLDLAYPSVPHYGLLVFIGVTPSVFDFRVDIKYTYEVRLLR
jgi:hypothetical protein